MARGQQSKNIVAQKILETFPGSFAYEKELRIPIQEDGELIQIKVTLTAAKVNIDAGGSSAIPEAKSVDTSPAALQITEEEKKEVVDLIKTLGL